ncbi:MAG TPA: nucleotidyltransferase domain-containing protein [Thermodesulfovibrionales bacterium]|jgi:predicted nucleotidyltransferase|nr:nucleotidyltransferase domain-containing protein [Thermodesulfovibrionales bacterium]
MAVATDSVIEAVKKYIRELERNNIPIQEAIVFGSYAKGDPKEESDIDIALVSTAFTGDRFEDRRKIVPLRRKIDNRIEPIPFRPEDFEEGGNLVDEIKKTGKAITI